MEVEHLSLGQRLRLALSLIVSLFFHHGPPQTARNTARWVGPPHGPPPIPMGRPPELRTFLRVIPVAQTQSVNEIDVTLFSLVCFEEGFIVHGMHSTKYGEIGRDNIWHAHPAFDVVDDRDNVYQWRGGSAGGSRFEFRFSPALDENARELTLTFTQFHWSFPQAQRRKVDEGPWVFTVALGSSSAGF